MKCQSCGYELEEGKLYCPNCGYEIQIVPDFEPEIEEEMTGALEEITSELVRHEKEAEKEKKYEQEERQRSKMNFYSTLAAACLVGVILLVFFTYHHMGTVETQLARAQKAAADKNYGKAIEYMTRVVEMDGSDMELCNTLGEYYALNGETQQAAVVFQDIIAADRENENAYRNLISIYEEAKDYEAINALIRASSSDKIVNTFIKYIANPPQFSSPQGSYDEVVTLKLTANTTGTVYFTLDGSEPDETSQVYRTPMLLDDGIYTVRAFFVNDYGIKSETAVQIYEIHLHEAHAPEINLDSGEYSEPQMIIVTAPKNESVYYTVDGSEPTRDSILYHNPIALPIGGSIYKFISYSEDGAASEVVTRNYAFSFTSVLDLPTAMNLLVVGLLDKGVIADINCSVPEKGGKNVYVCSSAIAINQKNYYLMVEYYEDLSGVNTRTGNLYCVDAETGGLYHAAIDEDGHYSVVSF